MDRPGCQDVVVNTLPAASSISSRYQSLGDSRQQERYVAVDRVEYSCAGNAISVWIYALPYRGHQLRLYRDQDSNAVRAVYWRMFLHAHDVSFAPTSFPKSTF